MKPSRKTERAFQREWLEELGATLETFIANPGHRRRGCVMSLVPEYLNAIRVNVYPENKERFNEAEKQFQMLNRQGIIPLLAA
jgi:hypothetical protein